MKSRFDWFIAIIIIFTLLSLQREARSESAADSDLKKSSTSYKVHVDVKEIKNRVVEGKVRNHTIRIDQPKEFGADDSAPTPPETLAFALGSCFVSTGRLIAMQKNMNLRTIEAVVESELDFAKALGASDDQRAGFSGFKLIAKIDADMTSEEKEAFIREIASRCPMCDNLLNPTPIAYELAK